MKDPLTIESGTMRQAVTVESQSTTKDAAGQATSTWTTSLQTRAAIRTLTLSERSSASGLVSQASHRITFRYQSSVPLLAGMRIVHGSHTYLLQAVENVLERNRVITCLALELTPTQ